jgi:DNA processing protein
MRRIRRGDPEFPEKLTRYPAMPSALYLIGYLPEPEEKIVAIVGSRGCTPYGRSEARRFGRELARCGVGIVSGMASGVDCAAQEGAIEAGGRTYAVLGCGADVCYPASSRRVYDAICGGAGGILSEYEPGARPLAWHFPIRNRIISALADLVLVIEAREKSGSLITAGYALDQGKTVYALPGRSTDPMSRGCNSLIGDGAGIALDVEQILMELGIPGGVRDRGDGASGETGRLRPEADPESAKIPHFDPESAEVYRLLDPCGITAGEIAERSGIAPERVLSILIRMALEGLAVENGSGFFSKPTGKPERGS